jgi:truncated hemoglobin YjbI
VITESLSPDWLQLMHIAVRDVDPEDDQTVIVVSSKKKPVEAA